MFGAPDSTPPSTPGKGYDDDDLPSTTPAGPPPTNQTRASFTPAGQPPSSIFNSSVIPPSSATGGAGMFKFGNPGQSSSRAQNLFAPKSTPGTGSGLSKQWFTDMPSTQPPLSSPPLPQGSGSSDDGQHAEEEDLDDDMHGMLQDEADLYHPDQFTQSDLQHGNDHEDDGMDDVQQSGNGNIDNAIGTVDHPDHDGPFNASFGLSILERVKFAAEGYQQSPQKAPPPTLNPSTLSQIQQQTVNPPNDATIGGLAKSHGASRPAAGLTDESQLVVDVNDLMEELEAANSKTNITSRNQGVFEAIEAFWQYFGKSSSPPRKYTGEYIGPGEEDSNLTKFNFVFSILSQIYQPPTQELQPKLSGSRFGRSSLLSQPTPQVKQSIPKILLTWLNTHHDTNPTQPLHNHPTGFSSNPNFWEIVRSVLLRGQFRSAITLLRGANFDVAHSALHDGEATRGYKGARLTAVTKAVARLIQVLQNSPPNIDDEDNWETWTLDWFQFKMSAQSALDDLQTTAEGQSRDRDVRLPKRKSKRPGRKFGNSSVSGSFAGEMDEPDDGLSFSQASRRAESAVPWSVYESLQLVYKQLTGDTDALLQASLDWVEATIALTVWWNVPREICEQLSQSSNDVLPSLEAPLALPSPPAEDGNGDRESIIDHSPQVELFREKLQDSFVLTTTSSDENTGMFRPDPSSRIEIALACALALDVEGIASIVRGWSATLYTAFVEIANSAGWFEQPHDVMSELNDEDMAVLGLAGQGKAMNKPQSALDLDAALERYSELLERVEIFETTDMDTSRYRQGWELAARAIGRMRNRKEMEKKMKGLIGRIELQDEKRVGLLLELCEDMGLSQQGHEVAERYATALLQRPSKQWGLALHYLARSHNSTELKEITQYLLTTSLVHSASYPPSTSLKNDPTLELLLSEPRTALARLSEADPAAARILGEGLSGYATLRKFYDLRDGTSDTGSSEHTSTKAAAALASLIRSSAERIRGGLVDVDAEAGPVPTDALLCLLGEALVFLAPRPASKEDTDNLPAAQFNVRQLFTILASLEDLETVPSGIREGSEALLDAALAASMGKPAPALSKSQSGQSKDAEGRSTASSFEMLVAASTSTLGGGGSGTSSGVLLGKSQLGQSLREVGTTVEKELRGVKRGWDWRKGLKEGAGGSVVRRLVRIAVAEGVGGVWGGDAIA